MAITAYIQGTPKPRNAIEQYVRGYCTDRYVKRSHGELPRSIEDARQEIVDHANRLRTEILTGRQRLGKIRITEIYVSGTYAGSGDPASKGFDIYGPGRKTSTVHISQDIPSKRR